MDDWKHLHNYHSVSRTSIIMCNTEQSLWCLWFKVLQKTDILLVQLIISWVNGFLWWETMALALHKKSCSFSACLRPCHLHHLALDLLRPVFCCQNLIPNPRWLSPFFLQSHICTTYSLQVFVSFLSTGLRSIGEQHDIFLTKSTAFCWFGTGNDRWLTSVFSFGLVWTK
jgi:hypothetical protein